jgi:iron complex transport system substrate-binding protein
VNTRWPRFALALFVATTAACGGEPSSSPKTAETRVVKDCAGVEVRLPAIMHRVVTTVPGQTAMVVAMGMGTTLVGVSDQDHTEGSLASLPKIAVYPTIPAESVAALSPDIVFVDRVLSGKNVDALRERFPCTFVTDSAHTLDRLRETFLRVGEALGVLHRGRLLAEELDVARSKAKVVGRPRVLVLGQVSPPPPYAIGPQGLLGDMVNAVGAENIAWDLPSASGSIVSEVVVSRAPEWILFANGPFPDALRRAWGSVPAVATEPSKHIVDISADDFQQGGPNTAQALERLAAILSGRSDGTVPDGK